MFRLDTDILKEKEAGELLYSFSSTEPSCLLATKAVLSCHPLPQVDAVCVLYCDSMLNLPDFSAAEKTYNMLTGLKEMIDVGEGSNFIIQTYNPEHHAIKGVYDPDVYYFTELEQRRALGYPPFGHLFTIGISGKNRDKVNKVAAEMANKLQSGFPSLQVLGPGLDPKWRVRGMYQYRIAIKGKDRGLISRGYNKVRNEMGSGSQVRITLHTEDGVVNTGEGVITVGDFRDQVF